jgi:von Willebrand factor type A domain
MPTDSAMGSSDSGRATAPTMAAPAAAPVVVPGSRLESSSKRAAPALGSTSFIPPRRPPPDRPPNPNVQSGQLTAGEHDDLLNPRLYASYVEKFLASETVQGIPRVDTSKMLSIVVQDSAGAPMPFVDVTLRCSDGNTLSLTTLADGRAVFFPELDRLGEAVTMTATQAQGSPSAPRRINLSDVGGTQEVRTRLNERAQRVRKFDLAVVIDATGSMGDEINFLKAELGEIISTLSRRHQGLDIRVAMVVYRDQGDEFVTRTYEFTNAMGQVQSNLSAQYASGGGDMPEAMEVAMVRAAGLGWRNDAVKSMLLVADAPPHSGDVPLTWTATEVARAKRIQIVPVAASGVDDAAQYIMRAMAAATQSRYAFLTDDSGIGNAHAEPSVDCYHVTKLDALVRRILDAQISGRRIEPTQSEIVRTVGDYDNGKCRGA